MSKFLFYDHFSDFDVFTQTVRGWNLDCIQLNGGPLAADLFQCGVGPVLLGRYYFNRRFDQRGASPSGVRTFGLVDCPDLIWCGRTIDVNTIIVFSATGDYQSFSPAGFLGRSVSVSEEHLAALSQLLGLPTIDELVSHDDFAQRCDQNAVASLRQRIDHLYRTLCESPALLHHPALQREISYELPAQLLFALNHAVETPKSLPSLRQRAIRMASEYIKDACQGDVTVEELCRVTGVSWRTLNYAFRDFSGVSPKQYLQAFRLNRVRRELSLASTDVKIADVANRWGFWHSGQFANDYQKFFGELPSDTLKHGKRI